MYYLPNVHELSVLGIYDAGAPNRERVVLRPMESINLGAFALILSVPEGTGVTPLLDQFLWLGDFEIAPPAWVIVYTGPGNARLATHETTGEPIYELYWGKPQVVFGGTPPLAVSLLRLGGVTSHSAPVVNPPSGPRTPEDVAKSVGKALGSHRKVSKP